MSCSDTWRLTSLPGATSASLRPAVIVLALFGAACASGGSTAVCSDGTRVAGTECHLAPDGTYYGDAAEIPPDVADDVADAADEEADEQSGLERVETVEIEIGGD